MSGAAASRTIVTDLGTYSFVLSVGAGYGLVVSHDAITNLEKLTFTEAANVLGVDVTGANIVGGSGVLHAGDVVNIAVNFASAVTLLAAPGTTPNPSLDLDNGGVATYVGGSGAEYAVVRLYGCGRPDDAGPRHHGLQSQQRRNYSTGKRRAITRRPQRRDHKPHRRSADRGQACGRRPQRRRRVGHPVAQQFQWRHRLVRDQRQWNAAGLARHSAAAPRPPTAWSASAMSTATAVREILWRNNSLGGDIGYYVNNDVLQGWHNIASSSTAYSVMAVADLDGDGAADMLFENTATGDTGFYKLANGAYQGWRSIGGAPASSTAYKIAGVGDFNGDGAADILWRNDATGDTGWYALNGDGTLQGWQSIGGGTSPAYSVVGVGDFNGDGRAEILWRNNSVGGDIGYYNNNDALQGWHDIASSSTAYSVVGVGDYAMDGVSDILLENKTSGDTGFYQIVNGAYVGWHAIGGRRRPRPPTASSDSRVRCDGDRTDRAAAGPAVGGTRLRPTIRDHAGELGAVQLTTSGVCVTADLTGVHCSCDGLGQE